MVFIFQVAENRLCFLINILVDVWCYLLTQNCKFFAEIWAQGDICNFGIGARLCDFLAESCVVGMVCFINYFFCFV